MEPVRAISGTAVPLRRADVDTDQIIPSDWLKRVERTGFGRGLFSEWRDDRSFVLNDERFAGATILVAGPNFGIGSSREHAVWALQDYGFKAVVSTRFGDIFRNNATKTGLLPVQVAAPVAQALIDAVESDPALEITIDVERRTVSAPGAAIEDRFELDDFTRDRLLRGLDEIGLTMLHDAEIASYEAGRPNWMPTTGAAARP